MSPFAFFILCVGFSTAVLITGMTLEQFCNLMNGLGYHSEKGERLKIKTVPMNETNDRVEREVAVEGVLAEESTKVPNSDLTAD